MANLETKYLGLKLKNPIIIGSSGLTKNIEGVKKAVSSGAGAVVLKSLFEEQIMANSVKDDFNHPEAYNYMQSFGTIEYLTLIKEAKKISTIPVIASINCYSDNNWIDYAAQIEQAGADALEINIMSIPTKKYFIEDRFEAQYYNAIANRPNSSNAHYSDSETLEKTLLEVIKKVRAAVKIPLAIKVAPFYTSLGALALELDKLGVNGLVMFNHGFNIDLDLESMQLLPKMHHSSETDMFNSFRWTAILANELKADICGSTGIHSAEGALKMICAGAATVQVCSMIYKEGFSSVQPMLDKMNKWMDRKGFASFDSVRGTLAEKGDVSKFSRMQYMKLSAGIE